ncbi:MAG: elongation factor Ts [Rickettsiaceae bacterium]|nr:elongation factor Ts [Rickettsiaceae bacterium]
MSISASLVKDLREKTGAGMMDCKKALVEANGNFDEAISWLRKKGLSAAAKKAGRVAAEGLVATVVIDNKGAAIELNSETDFVAKNESFQGLVKDVANCAIDCKNLEELKAKNTSSSKTVDELVTENIATIGENLNLRRMKCVQVNNGIIASYIHNSVTEGMGKIAVLVALESSGDKEKLMELGKQIAMHIAAARPECLNKENVDQALVQKEKDIFTEQSKASGKPDNIIEKMVEGRIRKFLEEIVLLEQTFVIDGKTKVSEVIANKAKELSTTIELTDYVRFELGAGIEKEQTNFADEVASVSK